jgi:hypothetical protein
MAAVAEYKSMSLKMVAAAVFVARSTPQTRFIFACHLQGCLNNTPKLARLMESNDDADGVPLVYDPQLRVDAPMCADSDLHEPRWALMDTLGLHCPKDLLGPTWAALPTCADVAAATQLSWDCIRRNESVQEVLSGPLRSFYVDMMPEWF